MKRMKILLMIIWLIFSGTACNEKEPDLPPDAPVNPDTPSFRHVDLQTDKAQYNPGEEVIFTIDRNAVPGTFLVRYKHLGKVVHEESVASETWKWSTPTDDFSGYMIEVLDNNSPEEIVYGTIGVDVSSEWTKFPRYGFLSSFGQLSEGEIENVIANLNRYHINGLQFYDWHNKHHMPLPVTDGVAATSWRDIINNEVYLNTVERYINAAHGYNMKAMFYNLIYGAWENAEGDGVSPEWYIFTDAGHSKPDYHALSSPFLSNIYLLNPSDAGWQEYINNQHGIVYEHLNFDGFHMDQLGNRGTRYNYEGIEVNLANTYQEFIESSKASAPEKSHVMNAVSQYGQQGIASAPVDFIYTEVWSPYESYKDLADIIRVNNFYGKDSKNTVLAAYVNYNLANSPGYFNTASVLFTNAVIFAFGGAHLELGEHMLGKEYFPNDNLQMREDLRSALVNYYDFLTAYENILRNGGDFTNVDLTSGDGKLTLDEWPSGLGSVAVVAKKIENRQIIHLLNFMDAVTLEWRDNNGIQTIPGLVKDAELTVKTSGVVSKIWVASPDIIGGASRSLEFNQESNMISFTLPELKYWTMIVIEY